MKIDPKQIAKMITEDPYVAPSDHFDDTEDEHSAAKSLNWTNFHETMNEGHDYLDHHTDTVVNVHLGPWLLAKPSEIAPSDHFDDFEDEYEDERGYDIKYEWTVHYYPEEPQTINYPGAPAYEEIEDLSVSEITRAGDGDHEYPQGVIEAAEAYFWEVLSQEL